MLTDGRAAEITPVRMRGVTLAVVTFSILPFIPYQIYIQELYLHANWRYSMCIVGIWNFLAFLGILFSYNPPPRTGSKTAGEIARSIDYFGGCLSIAGVTLFLTGLQTGGYQFPWSSGPTLGPLIVGILLLFTFVG
jgi:Fungal trichothecene efflux pump (TRI12)